MSADLGRVLSLHALHSLDTVGAVSAVRAVGAGPLRGAPTGGSAAGVSRVLTVSWTHAHLTIAPDRSSTMPALPDDHASGLDARGVGGHLNRQGGATAGVGPQKRPRVTAFLVKIVWGHHD